MDNYGGNTGQLDVPSPRSSLDLPQDTYQEPRSRSVDLRQPFRQPPILLRDRPASQCSSSRTRPTRNLAEFQGVKDHSQVSTPCYTARKDSVADQEEDSNSQEPPSPSGSDFRNPIQQESEYDHQLLVLTKEFGFRNPGFGCTGFFDLCPMELTQPLYLFIWVLDLFYEI